MEIKTPRGRVIVNDKTMYAEIKWNPGFEKKINREYGLGSQLQKMIDSTVLHESSKYIPFDAGTLMKSGELGTTVGSGYVRWIAPYAHYLYYGKVYVNPDTGKAAFHNPETGQLGSRKGVTKVKTDKDLKFQHGRFPKWVEVWKANHASQLLNNIRYTFGVDVRM